MKHLKLVAAMAVSSLLKTGNRESQQFRALLNFIFMLNTGLKIHKTKEAPLEMMKKTKLNHISP